MSHHIARLILSKRRAKLVGHGQMIQLGFRIMKPTLYWLEATLCKAVLIAVSSRRSSRNSPNNVVISSDWLHSLIICL